MEATELLEKVRVLMKEYAESNKAYYEADVYCMDRTIDECVRVINPHNTEVIEFMITTPDEEDWENYGEMIENE